MTHSLEQWIAAFLLAALISGVAFRLRALAPSGAVVATAPLGTMVVGTGGWWPGVIVVTFFATSSLLSKLSRATSLEQARGSRRDAIQVLANGWGILAGCILYALTGWQPWLLFGVGGIAAATADTWSSEVGRIAASPPRLITTWQPVPQGTSGAVSFRGLVASLVGGLLIAGVAALAEASAQTFGAPIGAILFGITFAGFAGSLLDSLLGATVQEQRWCDACNQQTESNPHVCGAETRRIAGIPGFSNDVVNALCVLCGALIGLFSGIL